MLSTNWHCIHKSKQRSMRSYRILCIISTISILNGCVCACVGSILNSIFYSLKLSWATNIRRTIRCQVVSYQRKKSSWIENKLDFITKTTLLCSSSSWPPSEPNTNTQSPLLTDLACSYKLFILLACTVTRGRINNIAI